MLKIGSPLAIAAVVVTALAGCAEGPSLPKMSDLNPFKKPETVLPGKRVPVLSQEDEVATSSVGSLSTVAVPAAFLNDSWSQPGGVASNSPGHLSYDGGLKTIWKASAGQGSSSKGRLTASPIVVGGKVFTLDASGKLSSFSASGGGRGWTTSLTPETENEEEGYGGGIAADGDVILAATGYGTVVAVNAGSGAKIWEKSLGAPIRSSPTAADGRVYVNTSEGQFFCLNILDGSELWRFRGAAQGASFLNNVSPAVAGEMVVVPYPTGEIVALKVASGEPFWAESVAFARGASSLASLSDPARPAIEGDAVFAVGNSGRLIATSQKSGERLWSLTVRGKQAPWVAGSVVFVVDVKGRLLAVSRDAGEVLWTAQLPAQGSWAGPVLASNRLWLTSTSGLVVGVDAATGKIAVQRSIEEKIAIAPVVAGGRLYVLTDDATLYAFD